MESRVFIPQPIVLPPQIECRRRPPRPAHSRQPDYDSKFDYDTLLYDVFFCDRSVCGVGPPLLNLSGVEKGLRIFRGGERCKWEVLELNRLSRWRLQRDWVAGGLGIASSFRTSAPPDSNYLTVKFAKDLQRNIEIGEDGASLFSGRRCLLTKSKNNNLRWIHDWARYHAEWHGCDAVLLYDNGSDRYSADQILEALSTIGGIKVAVVVEWPFKWGLPAYKGSGWDSDFAQYGALEHARWRFLRDAASVASLDIDEIVVGAKSVFEVAEASSEGAILFDGLWIENVPRNTHGLTPAGVRHAHFGYIDSRLKRCAPKWCVVPRKIDRRHPWRVHSFSSCVFTDQVEMRHFKGITTNWKYDRPMQDHDPVFHVEDRYIPSRMSLDD